MSYLSRKLTDAIPPKSHPTSSVSCQGHLASATLMVSIPSTRMRFSPPLQGMTKLANTLYASALQRCLTAIFSRIIVISLHPGGVYTYFNRPSISVFAAAPEDVIKKEKYRSAYLMSVGKASKPTKMARNEELAQELMDSVYAFLQEKRI